MSLYLLHIFPYLEVLRAHPPKNVKYKAVLADISELGWSLKAGEGEEFLI